MAKITNWRRPSLPILTTGNHRTFSPPEADLTVPAAMPEAMPEAMPAAMPAASSIYCIIQPFLQELESQDHSSLQDKGMLRWTFHKNVENDPSGTSVLVDELVKDLERVLRTDSRGCIIPMLLTLIYVIFQSVYIPVDLCERAYAACKSLLKLPKPYCSVGLACVRHMQTERSKPGALYQRTVIAEQPSLWSEYFPYQEMVFVFADEAVFSGPLGDAVQRHVEVTGSQKITSDSRMRAVLQHTLQAALGNSCHGNELASTLKDMGRTIEPLFQDMVQVMEQRGEDGGDKASGYRERLLRLYRRIMSETDEGEPSLCDTPLPTPEVRFHLWREEEQLWLQLEKWIQENPSEIADMQRASKISRDSGIERDLLENETLETEQRGAREDLQQGETHDDPSSKPRLVRKPCKKKWPGRSPSLGDVLSEACNRARSKLGPTASPKALCQFTACVVVMGDDRVLGRLAKAYHTLRTGGAQFQSLMTRVNLEIYYIPVTDQNPTTSPMKKDPEQSYLDLASHLGRIDPWYECNINNLAHWIPTLVESESTRSSSEPNPFLLDVLSYYKRTAWQPIHFTIYSVKISFPDLPTVEDVFLTHLEVEFPECVNAKESVKKESKLKICGPVVSVTYKEVSQSNRQVDRGKSVRTTGVFISTIPSEQTEDPRRDQLFLHFKEAQLKTGMIQSQNIKIKTVENRTFTVRLDKDTRRTYKDVKSIEISPCRYPLNTGISDRRRGQRKEKEVELSKCMTKGLSLPINTFSGISH